MYLLQQCINDYKLIQNIINYVLLCVLGKQYAIFMMKTIMVHILRKFEVKTHIRFEDIEYEVKIIMFSKHPVDLEFVPLAAWLFP